MQINIKKLSIFLIAFIGALTLVIFAAGKKEQAVKTAEQKMIADSIPNLPPDPGEAGKAMIEGIDSNKDGVRDDVERYIALNYGASQRAMMALRQDVIYTQKALLTETQEESLALIPEMVRAQECLEYSEISDKTSKAVTAVTINTEARYKAWAADEARISGHGWKVGPLDRWKSSCTINPDTLPN